MSSSRPSLESPAKTKLPRAVWILSFVSFFADVSSEMVYPLLPLFFVGALGATKMHLGVMEGSAVMVVAIMSAVAGVRSDRQRIPGGRVVWIRWGYGLPVFGKAIIALASAWPLVFGGRLLDRFGKGLRGAPRDALIADAVQQEQRGRAFGLHRAFDTAGAIVGVLISAFLLGLIGSPPSMISQETLDSAETPAWVYREIFGIAAILGIASFILTFFVRDSKSSQIEPVFQMTEKQSGLVQVQASLPVPYWYVITILVLFSLANSSDTFLLLRAREIGFSSWSVVLVYAFYNCFYSMFSYPAGALSDRFGRWRLIVLAWIIYACVYLALALLPVAEAWALWPLMAVYGVYMALTDGVGKALIADHAPLESRGKAMGIFYCSTGLATFVSSLVTGAIWDGYGSAAALLANAGLAAMAVAALGVLRKKLSPQSVL